VALPACRVYQFCAGSSGTTPNEILKTMCSTCILNNIMLRVYNHDSTLCWIVAMFVHELLQIALHKTPCSAHVLRLSQSPVSSALSEMTTGHPVYRWNFFLIKETRLARRFLGGQTFLFSSYLVLSSSPGRVKNCISSTSSRPALGPFQSHIQWVLGSLSLGVKRPGHEADHSPPTSADVKKM
jgi:hypothetical protein